MSEPVTISEDQVSRAVDDALAAIAGAGDRAQLAAVRTAHLAEHSPLAQLNASMRRVAPEDKAAAGRLIGAARGRVNRAYAEREAQLGRAEEERRLAEEAVDVTAVAPRRRLGSRHPVSLLTERMADAFVAMGWEVAEGPEVESEWYNFDALNFDPDHPARATADTFFVEPASAHQVLRTHTSPVQLRALLTRRPPVYVVAPGRVYRTDELDATHTPVFTQIEGLAVDRGLTMAHLKGTLDLFVQRMFGAEARVRLRPNFFPFTEPSAELDVWHADARGGPRWIEWGGCGMVNPAVLRSAGVDPEEFSGFAFGMGVERALQFRGGLADMRDIVEGDVRFSDAFGMVV